MEPRDEIWDLLGQAPLQEPDGWFTARTLARVRQSREQRSFWRWVGVWSLPALAVLILGVGLVWESRRHQQTEQLAATYQALDYLADNSGDQVWSEFVSY